MSTCHSIPQLGDGAASERATVALQIAAGGKMMEIKDIADIAQTIAVIAVAFPAFKGLTTWRDQTIGGKKIELAEEVLILAYTLQGVIEWARHPVSFAGEGEDREGRDQEPEARRNLNDSYFSRISRLSEHDEDFALLRISSMRFRAFFGEEGQEALAAFGVTRNRVRNAVGMLIRRAGDEAYPQNLRQELEDTIWDVSTEDEPDAIRQQINGAVIEIERLCRPILTKM